MMGGLGSAPRDESGRQLKWPLLRLLRVKNRLLGLRPCDLNVDPSDHSLIVAPRCDAEVMSDLAIEFEALVTHY